LLEPRFRFAIATSIIEALRRPVETAQYTSWAFGHRCRAAGIRPSTGTSGDALANAMCESFFATLECELVDRHRFASKAEAQIAVFVLRAFAAPQGPRSLRTIEGFSDPSRRHSSIGYLSPAHFEAAHQSDRAPMGTSKSETCP
jgi:putative transposase